MNSTFKFDLFYFGAGDGAWAGAGGCDNVAVPGQGYGVKVKPRGKRRFQRCHGWRQKIQPRDSMLQNAGVKVRSVTFRSTVAVGSQA